MALYTDGPPSSMEDLAAQDSQLLSVASSEGIDVTEKLELAHEEIGIELYGLLNRMRPEAHLVWISVRRNLASVVVTRPLKLWHTYRTLERVYADAYNSQLNDRYAGKRDQFHGLAKDAYDKLVSAGVGMVASPVPRPGRPSVGGAPGDLPDNLYYVTTTWMNQGNEEGAPAPMCSIVTASSTFLVQPDGAPPGVAGWNVYVGTAADCLILQNESRLPTGSAWVQTAPIASTGRKLGQGQAPAYHQAASRMLQRG